MVATKATSALDVARQIADVFVAEHGVAEVAVFGSVARGEATPDSDIDLVAIYPDMDYSQRCKLQIDLSSIAREMAGRGVDVWVTDWPEWKLRSTEVTLSFEHSIFNDCIVLAQQTTPYKCIHKSTIGLPMNNKEEIEKWLDDCKTTISNLRNSMPITESELEAMLEEDEDIRQVQLDGERIIRLRNVAALTAECVEKSLKLLVALEEHSVPRTHSAAELMRLLSYTDSNTLLDLLTEREWENVANWRQAGTYIASWTQMGLSAIEVVEDIERYHNAIMQILPSGIKRYEHRYGESAQTRALRQKVDALNRCLKTLNILTGQEK